jgi:hypothetical protein
VLPHLFGRTRRVEGSGSRPAASSFVPTNAARNPNPRAGLGKINLTGRSHTRLILAALCISAYASMACARTQLNLGRLSASQPINEGATSSDDDKGQSQPQGPAGPLTTGSGGTTAASPQGGAARRRVCYAPSDGGICDAADDPRIC